MTKSKSNKKVGRSRKTAMGDAPGDQIVKKMTFPNGSIASSAGSIIAVNTSIAASLVQAGAATEWASFAARYQQYRVRQIRLRMSPVYPVSGAPVAAGLVGHTQLYVADYIGTSVPGTAAQILSDERSVTHPTFKEFSFVTTWNKNPNAKLWNPTSAAPPAANNYGIAFGSNTTAALMAASTVYYTYDVEFVVEFRGSQ